MKTGFVAYWPNGIKQPGSICNSLVSIIDVAPTCLDIAGLEIAPNFQGKSFAHLLKQPKQEFRKYVFSEHNWHDYEAHERMLRSKEFLYSINSRPNYELGGPADSKRSPSQNSLNMAREKGMLTYAQNDNFVTPRAQKELFDVINDPMQLHNLASENKYKHILEELKNVMNEWREETKDSTPENLSPNQFDSRTGKKYEDFIRGEMPGYNSGATKVITNNLRF
jgi:N-sulfoglucosamine sulfohydrolase